MTEAPAHDLDPARLEDWLVRTIPNVSGPLAIHRFPGGQSNPTYRLVTPSRAFVLRRKPFGSLLPSAHAIEREFRVIAALGTVHFPVPEAIALCEDPAVIGSPFYLMQAVEGTVHWKAALPDLAPAARTRAYRGMITTLARLHAVDHEAIGLADFGRPGNYFARQVDRWTKQYRAADADPVPHADDLIDFLPRTVPEQERVSIVHGDYRIDNLVFHDTADGLPEIAAVLDWELSTLGDPMADFSYLLMQWALPADGRSAIGGIDFAALGIPDRDEAVAIYCEAAHRKPPASLDWYFAYNLFRLVGIIQGIAGRIRSGNAASPQAAEMVTRLPRLAAAAWDFARRGGAR